MADLSQYLDFSVLLDKSGDTPVILLTDTSAYPTGVQVTVTGVFSVTQPDGVSVTGVFTSPDINGVQNAVSKELRLAVDNSFQNGMYVFTYTVKATGYDDTVLTKTFTLSYTTPTAAIQDLSNVFTPYVAVIDSTVYLVAGFNTPTLTRAWSADISYVGRNIQTVTSTNALFDLQYSGSYYDAHYDIYFTGIATYVSTTAAWLSLKDRIVPADKFQIDAYTPATLVSLRNSLALMQQQITNGTYCGFDCGCGSDYSAYNTAQSIFNAFIQNGQNNQNAFSLFPDYLQLQALFVCSAVSNLTHTNGVIPAYNWGTTSGGGSGSSGMTPIFFTVDGDMPYAPHDGDSTYTNPILAGITKYFVYSSADADFLTDQIAKNPSATLDGNPAGSFSWAIARTFVHKEKYTIIFI